MPIYAYRCTSCGHAQDVLQKISDPLLTVCPACGASTYAKQVTAAGFQLKGSGWYVTDFRGGNAAGGKEGKDDKVAQDDKAVDAKAPAASEAKPAKPTDAASPAPAGAAPVAAPAPAPASAPARPPSGGSGGSSGGG